MTTRAPAVLKKIPGNTRSYISTHLLDPNPTRYPVFCPIPDPTRPDLTRHDIKKPTRWALCRSRLCSWQLCMGTDIFNLTTGHMINQQSNLKTGTKLPLQP